jgi:Uma2 family endonuclease
VTISEDDYIEGAPELVAEVASSSVSFDLHTKFNVYRRCGVKEYIVWRVLDRAIDWFVLRGGAYEPHTPAADGLLKSAVFPGLWLDPQAMLSGDLAGVLKSLQAGIASAEHEEFLKQLAKSR